VLKDRVLVSGGKLGDLKWEEKEGWAAFQVEAGAQGQGAGECRGVAGFRGESWQLEWWLVLKDSVLVSEDWWGASVACCLLGLPLSKDRWWDRGLLCTLNLKTFHPLVYILHGALDGEGLPLDVLPQLNAPLDLIHGEFAGS
jgi:hypothetical protein